MNLGGGEPLGDLAGSGERFFRGALRVPRSSTPGLDSRPRGVIPETEGEGSAAARSLRAAVSRASVRSLSARVFFSWARERFRSERYNLLTPAPFSRAKPLASRYCLILLLLGVTGEEDDEEEESVVDDGESEDDEESVVSEAAEDVVTPPAADWPAVLGEDPAEVTAPSGQGRAGDSIIRTTRVHEVLGPGSLAPPSPGVVARAAGGGVTAMGEASR